MKNRERERKENKVQSGTFTELPAVTQIVTRSAESE